MLTADQERDIASIDVVHHDRVAHYRGLDDETYFPANHVQLRNLLGKLLTILDTMGLDERAHKGAKTLLVQEFWRWWDEVVANCTTSYEGCLAPVVLTGRTVDTMPPSNRWGWDAEADYLRAQAERTA